MTYPISNSTLPSVVWLLARIKFWPQSWPKSNWSTRLSKDIALWNHISREPLESNSSSLKWEMRLPVLRPDTFNFIHNFWISDMSILTNIFILTLSCQFYRNFDFWLFSLQLCSQLLPLLLGWAKVSSGEMMSMPKIFSLIFYQT